MPETKITKLPNSEVKIEFVVELDEYQPYLDEAVRQMTKAKPLPGFRPGHATYQDVKNAFGEMKIYEAALEPIVRAFYVQTILAEKIASVGSPAISVDQLTPGQPIKFTVTAPVEPIVTNFPDLNKCKAVAKKVEITEKRVDEVIEEMRGMRRKETLADRPATAEDLVIIDLEITKDRVMIEGGSGKDYRILMSEDHYIPGFSKELIGIKAGEERTFSLPFPKEHYQKHLAGQTADFKALAKGVYELALPALDADFAKGVGLESVEQLREKLKENLHEEAKHKAEEAAEIAMLEALVEHTSFSEVPELLVNEEVRRMLAELQGAVEEQGMEWGNYLTNVKKSLDELRMEFIPHALRRIRTAILIKSFAKQQTIAVTSDELDTEIDRILATLRPDDAETRDRVASPEYREYVEIQMRNRKTLEWLKKECISQ